MPTLGENLNFTNNFDPSFPPTALYIQWNTESSTLAEQQGPSENLPTWVASQIVLKLMKWSVAFSTPYFCIIVLSKSFPALMLRCFPYEYFRFQEVVPNKSRGNGKTSKTSKHNFPWVPSGKGTQNEWKFFKEKFSYMRTYQSLQSPPSALWSDWRFQPSLDLCLGWSPQKLQTWISV